MPHPVYRPLELKVAFLPSTSTAKELKEELVLASYLSKSENRIVILWEKDMRVADEEKKNLPMTSYSSKVM